jgi:hypothetical protein
MVQYAVIWIAMNARLNVRGAAMPDNRDLTITAPKGHSTGGAKVEHRRVHVSPDESKGLVWLPWKSNKCWHGDRPHKVRKVDEFDTDGNLVDVAGSVVEVGDLTKGTTRRRKPKGISTLQWVGR